MHQKLKQECKFSGPHQLPSNTVQWTHDSYVLIIRLKKRVRLFEEGATMQRIYIHGVPHYKDLSIVIILCYGFKALLYTSHQTWASVVKEPDSVACEQQRCRPVCASCQSDKCLCNLLHGKYIAKQLNLAH